MSKSQIKRLAIQKGTSVIREEFDNAFGKIVSPGQMDHYEVALWAAKWMANRLEEHFIQDCGPGCECGRDAVAKEINSLSKSLDSNEKL